MKLLDYKEVQKQLGKTSYVLLGNGFSIGCDAVFRYTSLYAVACNAGLSERAQKVFERMGTNNFESAMRLLEDVSWIGQLYGMPPEGSTQLGQDIDPGGLPL